jgi:hypothetical protein
MRRNTFTDRDLREHPAYGIPEAAGYLRLPVSTLRAWVLGQHYRAGQQAKFFKPVIEIAERKERQLSFINLVEAFVLSGIRREHEIPLPKVRRAVDYLRRTFNSKRPLADEQFETDGIDLFVEKMGALIGALARNMQHRRRQFRMPSGANAARRDAQRLASLTFFLDGS